MDHRNNFYRVDQRYNTKATAAPASHLTTNNGPPGEAHGVPGLSYHDEIESILQRWRQVQERKSQRLQQQQQQQGKPRFLGETKGQQEQACAYQYDEFDRIMEEDLANQLKELERQEQEQYKWIEQAIATQLEDDGHEEPESAFEVDYIEQLKRIEKDERFEKEAEEAERPDQQGNDVPFKRVEGKKHRDLCDYFRQLRNSERTPHEQQASTKKQLPRRAEHREHGNLRLWKQKHLLFLKRAMDRGNDATVRALIHLLRSYCHARKYTVQATKQHRNNRR